MRSLVLICAVCFSLLKIQAQEDNIVGTHVSSSYLILDPTTYDEDIVEGVLINFSEYPPLIQPRKSKFFLDNRFLGPYTPFVTYSNGFGGLAYLIYDGTIENSIGDYSKYTNARNRIRKSIAVTKTSDSNYHRVFCYPETSNLLRVGHLNLRTGRIEHFHSPEDLGYRGTPLTYDNVLRVFRDGQGTAWLVNTQKDTIVFLKYNEMTDRIEKVARYFKPGSW